MQHLTEAIEVERLGQVLARPELDGFDGAVDRRVPGHQNDFAGGNGRANLAEQIESVDVRHPQVDHGEIGGPTHQRVERLAAAGTRDHLEAGLAGHPLDHPQHGTLIVDNQEQRLGGSGFTHKCRGPWLAARGAEHERRRDRRGGFDERKRTHVGRAVADRPRPVPEDSSFLHSYFGSLATESVRFRPGVRHMVCVIAHPVSAHALSRGIGPVPFWQYSCEHSPAMTPVASVLIVDDEPAVRDLMARWVTSLGLQPTTASNAEEALARLRARHHDLAVIDVMMPGKDGLWLAGELRRDHPHTAVVIATGYTQFLESTPAETPIADLLIKPFKRERFVLAVDRGRQWRRRAVEDIEWHVRLSAELQERVKLICQQVEDERQRGIDEASTLLAIASERIPEVVGHSERVARFCVSVAQELGVPDSQWPFIERAARFHDIGKAAIPDALLTKPCPLTPGEIAIMRRHVNAGSEILEATRTLGDIEPVVLASHEWFGGGGYPEKLAGTAIPLASRVIGVIDAYDAMTQDRAYRVRLDSNEAISELLRYAPTQFDPDVVVAFLTVLGRH